VCFVPEEHLAEGRLPAVSGSSGHLVVARLPILTEKPHWPGQVFAQADLDYSEAMFQYVAATRDRLMSVRRRKNQALVDEQPTRWRKEWQGRAERYATLQQRRREDATWKALRDRHHTIVVTYRKLSQVRRKEQRAAWEAELNLWQAQKGRRQALLETRRQENQAWHQRNRALQAASGSSFEGAAWIAVLVVTDNCTRQCLALPAFRSGAKLSSQELVAALRTVLPAELQFLISDQGVQFRSKAFAELARKANFIHVPVYRHRPESNGIAERFVQTLKRWLQDKSWLSQVTLEALLAQFQPEYNERPHQGLAIPGLSPNEFAKRIWLM
jgi:transposase InsO family protein